MAIQQFVGPLTVNDVAREIGCSKFTVYRWLHGGLIRFNRVGNQLLTSAAEVEAFRLNFPERVRIARPDA